VEHIVLVLIQRADMRGHFAFVASRPVLCLRVEPLVQPVLLRIRVCPTSNSAPGSPPPYYWSPAGRVVCIVSHNALEQCLVGEFLVGRPHTCLRSCSSYSSGATERMRSVEKTRRTSWCSCLMAMVSAVHPSSFCVSPHEPAGASERTRGALQWE
jgi:hypothetical protein